MLNNGTCSRGMAKISNLDPQPNANMRPPRDSSNSMDSRSTLSGKKRSESAADLWPMDEEISLNVTLPPENMESEETDLSISEEEDSSWISWFCGLKGNEFFCRVDEDFIVDDFNLCGLQGLVPYYEHALDVILDNDSLSDEIDDEDHVEVESSAEMLYGLIHARYILTNKGLSDMHEKYKKAQFGRCPRTLCAGYPCLPAGTSDILHNDYVKLYCPNCEDLYFPRCKHQCSIDGAYLGTTFPHLYLMHYPPAKAAKPVQTYVPRVFGFKIHKNSR